MMNKETLTETYSKEWLTYHKSMIESVLQNFLKDPYGKETLYKNSKSIYLDIDKIKHNQSYKISLDISEKEKISLTSLTRKLSRLHNCEYSENELLKAFISVANAIPLKKVAIAIRKDV